MSIDATRPIPAGPPPEWDLPKILDIRIRRVPYEPPKLHNFRSALSDHKEAVEFLVRTSGPIPSRALGPALFVGDARIIESEAIDENLYRFLAFDIERLKPGTAIRWGWMNAPEKEQQITEFRYEEHR